VAEVDAQRAPTAFFVSFFASGSGTSVEIDATEIRDCNAYERRRRVFL